MRYRRIFCWWLICWVLSLTSFPSLAESLQVITRHVPPFAIKQADGSWSGISIDLWRKVADRLGFESQFREAGLKDMLGAMARAEADVAVAALTITSEREAQMDFSHPFLSTGLAIAVHRDGGGGWLAVTERLFSEQFLKVVAGLLGLLLVVGVLVWALERRRNAQFGGKPIEGIGSGLWWSAVTMTTVGYGDKAPTTPGGRAVAMVWMFASVIIISSFTAAIATALTVGELGGKVQGEGDLGRVRLATVADSTSGRYLEARRYRYRGFAEVDQALQLLADGEVDAVVYDAPILRFRVRQQFDDQLAVLPGSFERQDYGIAFPSGSALREPVNRVLLELLEDRAWEDTLFDYLGER